MSIGRILSSEFQEKFNDSFSFVIDFVRKNDDVFIGIRNECIELYVNGGCFFEISKCNKKYIAKFNVNGYGNYLEKSALHKVMKITGKELNDDTIREWISILNSLKDTVKAYMFSHKVGNGTGSSREKILQQRLALSFNNNNTKYYNYDIEYNIESLKDYYYFKDGTNDIRTHTLGRMDNMIIEVKNNKLKLYLMEVKEGMDAIKNTNYESKSKNKKFDDFGQGVIGHVNLYMEIIDKIKRNEDYKSKYNDVKINIRDHIFNEIKNTMKFLKNNDLIKNDNYKNINYDALEFDDVELVFYLGGYNMNSSKFEEHLGITGKKLDSVKNLINNNLLKYRYISRSQMYDFKYHKDFKAYNDTNKLNNEDLDISSYNQIRVNNSSKLLELYEE